MSIAECRFFKQNDNMLNKMNKYNLEEISIYKQNSSLNIR